jgi:DNA-binding IscR family transcriptional regulator
VRAVEGGRNLSATDEHGPIEFLWNEVDAAIASVIDHKTIAELAREWRERQAQFVPNWEI